MGLSAVHKRRRVFCIHCQAELNPRMHLSPPSPPQKKVEISGKIPLYGIVCGNLVYFVIINACDYRPINHSNKCLA
jgi:hypothetical protein